MKSKLLVFTIITLLTVFPLSLSAQRGGDDEAVAIETLTAGEGENKIELFGKVLAAVIIYESIGKRGGKHGNS